MDSPSEWPPVLTATTLDALIPLSAQSVKCCAVLFSQNGGEKNKTNIIALRANKTYATAAASWCNIDPSVAAIQEESPDKLCSVRFPTLLRNYFFFFPIKFKISSIFNEPRRHLRAIFPFGDPDLQQKKITLPGE